MIDIKNVSKWYGTFQVLTDNTTSIKKGEVVVVCGPSGSGKSTLIKTVNALEPFQKGDIVVDGISISDPKIAEALRFGVNYVDAADCYNGGRCEPAVASFHKLAKARKKLWITSKSDEHEPAGFLATLQESLRKLETDYVDMYFLHALKDPGVFTKELEQLVTKLERLATEAAQSPRFHSMEVTPYDQLASWPAESMTPSRASTTARPTRRLRAICSERRRATRASPWSSSSVSVTPNASR